MLRFKFGAWAVVLMLAALSFGACSGFQSAFQYYGSLETIISGSSEYRMGNERCVLCGRLLGGR